jgi:two-component system alkaline phosphatase synthesis response regulator PhoP
MKVLVAEDDANTRAGLIEILEMEGYDTVAAANGADALALFDAETPDFVCLDVMMPQMNGYDVCREIRRQNARVPVIFISAKSEEVDKVIGLELGADDFIMKPFGVKEVVARIRAITRRCFANSATVDTRFTIGDLTVSPEELRARRGDTVVDLSLRDVKILQLFASSRGKALTRNMIYHHAWGEGSVANSRCLDQHIAQLRKRIERDPRQPEIIRTVHGIGYRWDAD